MTRLTKSFASVLCQGGLAAMVVCGFAVYAQEKKACGGIDYVGMDAGNPFTAERITTNIGPNAQEKVSPIRELLARDEAGRIRIEKRALLSASANKTWNLSKRDGKTFQATQEDLNTHIIIHDCTAGTDIQIEPGTRTATIKEHREPVQTSETKRPYSAAFFPGPGTKSSPLMVIEDLGYREIQGVPVRGLRMTNMGVEKDGDWNRKPIHEWEQWISDDLSAFVMVSSKDLKTGKGNRWELSNIKRERPDLKLFEIPPGYKVNPKPDEIPFVFGSPK